MSTWTSKARAAGAGALFLGVAACAPPMPGGPAPQALAVQDGAVIVAGPAGYCIDRSGSRQTQASSFVLLGSCAALSGPGAAPAPRLPAVLTASVLGGALPEGQLAAVLPQMSSFFRSGSGRTALSRSGRAGSVEVADVSQSQGVMFLRTRDTSDAEGRPVEPEYWRAILSVNGRLVTLSVLGLSDRPIPSDDKRRLLDAFIARIRAANPAAEVASAG